MSYTQEDLDAVNAAIVQLASGKTRVRVTYDGATTEYAQQDLDKLRSLRNDIRTELHRASRPPRFRIRTSKGL